MTVSNADLPSVSVYIFLIPSRGLPVLKVLGFLLAASSTPKLRGFRVSSATVSCRRSVFCVSTLLMDMGCEFTSAFLRTHFLIFWVAS